MSKVYSKSFFTQFKKLKSDIFKRRDKESAKVYATLEKYISECSYTNYRYAKEFVQMLLEGYPDEHIANFFGISESTVRWRKVTCFSDKLYEKFGKDFFELMENYQENKDEIDKRIVVGTNTRSNRRDFITYEVNQLIMSGYNDSTKIENINIEECRKELLFLARHSKPSIRSELESLDLSKLEYLLRVLDGQAGTTNDKYNFMCLMNNK